MSMKVTYRPTNSKFEITFEVSGQKDFFEQSAQLEEILSNDTCGKCQSHNIVFQVREVDDNKFYELRCADCGSVLAFGSHKVGGTIFPKRFEEDGKGKDKTKIWLPNNGWVKYNPQTGKKE